MKNMRRGTEGGKVAVGRGDEEHEKRHRGGKVAVDHLDHLWMF